MGADGHHHPPRDHKQAERAPRPGQPAVQPEHGTQAAHRRNNHVPVQKTAEESARQSSPPLRNKGHGEPHESENHLASRQRSRPIPKRTQTWSHLFFALVKISSILSAQWVFTWADLWFFSQGVVQKILQLLKAENAAIWQLILFWDLVLCTWLF